MVTTPSLFDGGLSRRGFLRALGLTACSVAVPGLALPSRRIATGLTFKGLVVDVVWYDEEPVRPSRITLEKILEAKRILNGAEMQCGGGGYIYNILGLPPHTGARHA